MKYRTQKNRIAGRDTSYFILHTSYAGFTLIETFVAISILLTAITAPLTLASKGLAAALIARDQLAAGFLAQEGVEYVRWQRDSSRLQGQGWLAALGPCVGASCTIDARIPASAAPCGETCPVLRYNAATGFYTYTGSDPATKFTRTIQLSTISASEVQLTVTVSWAAYGTVRNFVVRENLFDWE